MLKVEIDGRGIEVPNGATVMDAANQLGIYIPHFCYHPKLSIAANCRMCLVQVEKAPKPLPACATPCTDGMKVQTASDFAKKAQSSVMEFLLINHPLDCPICDQGGECQLQDLAVGYGKSSSRYNEPKRVVLYKDMGPLVSAEEMSRCIHCTRCVRFGQEVAGIMELGMMGRGEHSEIVSFVGRSVDSELSGNMIDLCPVGALTSRPFRYTARTWELSRRRSISPHDSLGANLIVQVKTNKVMRVLPLENEAVNECWLSDKDRFSYTALDSDDRLTTPMVKIGGEWQSVDWQVALEHAAAGLKRAGADVGGLAAPHATLEEMYLLQKLVRGLGSESVDFRLRQSDFSLDGKRKGAPWLGMPIADLAKLDRVLVVGSFLRKDHPLLANRFRQAAKRGQQVNVVHAVDDDSLVTVANKAIVPPSRFAAVLAQLVRAVAEVKQVAVPAEAANAAPTAEVQRMAASIASGANVGLFLGNLAVQHPRAAELQALVQRLADMLGAAKVGVLGEAANSVGGHVAGCLPSGQGRNAAAMLAQPMKAYVTVGVEPLLDTQDPVAAMAALGAGYVVALTSYRSAVESIADVMLPIGPFTETSGTFINTEGRVQGFNGTVRPLGAARPGWKVLRVLANLLDVPGFDQDASEAIRDECLGKGEVGAQLDNRIEGLTPAAPVAAASGTLERLADVPIYFTDAIARRAPPLQATNAAKPPRAAMRSELLERLGVKPGDKVRVKQGSAGVVLEAARNDKLPEGCVQVSAAHASTAALGAMFGAVTVERA
jgi:NADH-quinone oxidoreductase subunit G